MGTSSPSPLEHVRELSLAGAGGIDPLVQDIGICLIVAGILAVVFERLRVPTIAALLVAGVVIGPVGASIVYEKQNIETIAHLGLTLLLFVIGLEVNLRNLLASGKTIVLTGLFQVPLTIGIAWAFFFGIGAVGLWRFESAYLPLYLALACGFSSTLLVVKQLQTRYQLDTASGRLSIAMLIFQDVWAIIILAVQPNFADPKIAPVVATFIGIALVAVVAVVFARWILPVAFRVVAKLPELVVSVALAWCFGLALFGVHMSHVLQWFHVNVTVSVSMEMCALIAGSSIASLPYAHEVVTKVTNLRDFFVTLFFVALGMGIPIPTASTIVMAVVLALVAVVLRFLVFVPVLYLSGADRKLSITTSTRLAQVSEFCLVIVYLGRNLEHVPADMVAAVIFAFVLTALATTFMFKVSDTLDARLDPFLTRIGMKPLRENARSAENHDPHPRIVLLGFHRLASSLVYDLKKLHPDLLRRILVVDFNVGNHAAIRALGVRVVYGDVANGETLRHAHLDTADVIISTVGDDLLKGTNNTTIARTVRAIAPNAKIVVNALRLTTAASMYEAGADYVFSWRTETSNGLMPALEAALEDRIGAFRDELQDRHLTERREVID